MSKKKVNQAAPEKKKQVQYQIKLSEDCKKCMKCETGRKYVASMIPGKAYKGCVCRG